MNNIKQKILDNEYIKKFLNNQNAVRIFIIILIIALAYFSYTRIDEIKYLKKQIENQNEIIQICEEGKDISTGATSFMSSYWEQEIDDAEKEKNEMNLKLIRNISICSISAVASIFILIKNKNLLLKRSKNNNG